MIAAGELILNRVANFFLASNFFLSLVMSASMNMLWTLLNSL